MRSEILMRLSNWGYLTELTQRSFVDASDASMDIRLLFLFLSMAAGIPAVGMGTYVVYQGIDIRNTGRVAPSDVEPKGSSPQAVERSNRVKGTVWVICGMLMVVGGLALPILVWLVLGGVLHSPTF